MPGRRLSCVALVALASCLARVGAAQAGGAPATSARRDACLDTIPDSVLHRVPVYLTPNPVDSVSWLFHLEPALVGETGDVTPPKVRMGIPIFSVNAPPERQVAAERVRVSYPPRLRSLGFMGHVLMQFVVDTTGQVDRATIRDLYPAGVAPLPASQQPVYDEFIRSVRLALEGARYRPARIGGCVVRQMVQQPFAFVLGDGRLPTR